MSAITASDIAGLERVLVPTPAGAEVPLGQLAHIVLTPGPAMIRDEGGQLAGYVLRGHGDA